MAMKRPLQFGDWNARGKTVIKIFEGQAEFGPKSFQGHGRDAILGKN
jgi:hypothetical protein